jgi:hypothetical protein
MIAILGLLLAAQGAPVWRISPAVITVGDTVTLSRGIPAEAGARARPQPLTSAPAIEPLSDPVVIPADGGLVIRYTISVFEPGMQPVAIPPIEVLHADGDVESVMGDTAWVSVTSVLPPTDTSLTPKGSLAPIARNTRRTWPAVVLPVLVLLGALWWATARRTTRTPAPTPSVTREMDAEGALARWVAAGEGRAAAAFAVDQLREEIARREPAAGRALDAGQCVAVLEQRREAWPVRRIADTLRALERAAYAPAVGMDVLLVTEQALALARDLDASGEQPS